MRQTSLYINRIIKDDKYYKDLHNNVSASWDSDYGNSAGYGGNYYDCSWGKRKPQRQHEFTPVVLVISTVWNCKYCGAKKEECKSDYCEDNTDLDFGTWG